MSPNKAPQNQNASSPIPSQEPGPKPKVPSLQEAYKAASSLLRKCWSKRRALPRFIRWKLPSMVEYILGWLAKVRRPIIVAIFFFWFHKPLEDLAGTLLITPILAQFRTGWISNILLASVILILLGRFYQLWRRHYVISGAIALGASLTLIGYLYYRCSSDLIIFYGPFGNDSWIAFADIIPLFCFLTIALWILFQPYKKRATKNAEHKQGFLTDHPINNGDDDALGWNEAARALTQRTLDTTTEDGAFTLGIIASWGEGKSSFIRLMEQHLEQIDSSAIVMRFNPWCYDGEAQLSRVFFEELRRKLAPYSSKLSNAITTYSHLLLAIDSNWTRLTHQFLILPQNTTAQQFAKLAKHIKELGRKVVIFIDDVDRLNRDELIELFNLVRNYSNLPSLYFILAYDKSYVLDTLGGDSEDRLTRYPEKILQEEYPLPKTTPEQIIGELTKHLRGKLSTKEAGELIHTLAHAELNLTGHLRNIRKTKRMVNAFLSRYDLLSKEGEKNIKLFDLFIFELIHFAYRDVYKLIKSKYLQDPNSPRPMKGAFADASIGNSQDVLATAPDKVSFLNSNVLQTLLKEDTGSTDLTHRELLERVLRELELVECNEYDETDTIHDVATLLFLLWDEERVANEGQLNHKYACAQCFYRIDISPLTTQAPEEGNQD